MLTNPLNKVPDQLVSNPVFAAKQLPAQRTGGCLRQLPSVSRPQATVLSWISSRRTRAALTARPMLLGRCISS